MKLVYKLWLGIGAALLAALAVMAWFGYQHTQRSVEAALLEEGRSIHGVLMAMRRTYQRQFLSSGLELDARTVGFLPAHAMPRIAHDFQAFDRRGVRFNNVSDRARNPGNQADTLEMGAIRHFRAHPEAKERLTSYSDQQGRHYFHYTTPIWTEPYCLKCHGNPEDAPAAIRQGYELAYGYKVGDLRGILSVKLPAAETEARILGLWWHEQAIHLAVVALALLLAGGLVHLLVVRRLNLFRVGARRLAAGDYAWRVPEGGTGETAELAHSLNEMAQAIEHSQGEMRLAASVFDHAREGIMITDAAGNLVDVNPAFSQITGFAGEEVLGKTPRALKSGRHDPAFYTAMWRTIIKEGHWIGEIWNRRKNGEEYPERLSISSIRDPAGAVSHYLGVFTDISQVKQQEQLLQHLAQHDALTGIPNRILLADRMHQAIAQARRNGDLLAVGYLDLDGFKPINDTYGHDAGDRLLVEMARRMSEALRSGDTVARLGGDEFVFLLQGLSDLAECETTLDRLLSVINQPALIDGQIASLSASIGVSLYPSDDEDPDTLLRHADQAMYAAKQAGRGRYTFHDVEGDRRARSHRETQERIRLALETNEFELFYQPQVNMRSGEIVGAEALIRWRHPERGLLSPAAFLPVIENTELDIALGEWVLQQALRQLAAWREQGLELTVSINISAQHIQRPDFVEKLLACLAVHPEVSPRQLELEILETAALEDLARVSEVIRTCQRMGSDFALDDFGTGYSSLTYLKHLPVQILKIDQSFVHDMLRDPDDLAIVEGVIALAEAFGRDIVAEGVDSLEAGLLLLQLGCAVAQGYSIARPMPAAELPAWVAKWDTPHAWSEENFRRWHREDFALLLAEYNHRDWIDNLADRIEGEVGSKTDVPLTLDQELCRFGRWYHGSGQVRYGTLPEFTAIDPVHRQVHELGAELLKLLHVGKHDEARKRLPELFALRDELLGKLRSLQDLIVSER
ncbi:MAG: EAL domain-containing protein [Pseudomonadota bacterium]|nr:EAL domain-containing protein [Pseudomonadota bacterium]MDP1904535.1 EAL domain-containing protein [Pseudomonadota bacterium]MDP2353941.1 EAL domain-containing protein [Pseudomonadota bacterium]